MIAPALMPHPTAKNSSQQESILELGVKSGKSGGTNGNGLISLLTSEEEQQDRRKEEQAPTLAPAPAPAPAPSLSSSSSRPNSNSNGNSNSSSITVIKDSLSYNVMHLMDNLRTLALFSDGDFRACVRAVLLSVPLYQARWHPSCHIERPVSTVLLLDEGGWTDCSVDASASASAGATMDEDAPISSVGSFIAGGAALKSPIYATFDHLGDILSNLLEPCHHTPSAPLAIMRERHLEACKDVPVQSNGVNNTLQHPCTAKLSEGNAHLQPLPHLSSGYLGLVVPVVTSVSPRQCLAAGGELLTIRGRHFLQKKHQSRCLNISNLQSPDILGIDPRSASSQDDFLSQSSTVFTDDEELLSSGSGSGSGSDSAGDLGGISQQSRGQCMSEHEAALYLKKVLVTLEVLVNEIPVSADRVFIISDTEISFIMPITAAGLAIVIVRMTDDLPSSFPLPLSLTQSSSSCEADTAKHSTLESKVHSTFEITDLRSSSQLLAPSMRSIVVRSDISGCEAGGVMVRDRKVRDIRLFFAPQKKMSLKDRELDRERNKDKNISFFMTEGSSLFKGNRKNRCDDEDVDEDLFEGPIRTSTASRKGWEEGSDSCSDSDAFMEDNPPPPRSRSRSSGSLKRKSLTSASESESESRTAVTSLACTRGGSGDSSNSRAHSAKRLKSNRPPLDLFVRPGRPVTTVAATATATTTATTVNIDVDVPSASHRVIDIDNDLDFSDDDETLLADRRRKKGTGSLNGRIKHRVIDDDDDDDDDDAAAQQPSEAVGAPLLDPQTSLETLSDDSDLAGEAAVQGLSHDKKTLDHNCTHEEGKGKGAGVEFDKESKAQEKSLTHTAPHLSSVAGFALNKALTDAVTLSLDALIAHPLSQPFRDPVDPVDAPGYLTVILHPMDLSTVLTSLEEGLYVCVHKDNFDLESSVDDSSQQSTHCKMTFECIDLTAFLADMRLVWSNCLLYNHHSDPIAKQAKTLHEMFERMLYEKIEEISLSTELRTSPPLSTEYAESEGPTQDTLPYSSTLIEAGGAITASACLPPILEVKEGVVKYVLGSEPYVITFPYSKMTVEDTVPQASIPIVPALGLLKSLSAAEVARYELQSTETCGLDRQELWSVPEGMEYCDTSSGSALTLLHTYPCDTSSALYSSIVSHPAYDEELQVPVFSSEVRADDERDNRGKGDEGISDKDALRAIEEGCIEALESMWQLQDSFSYCDILSSQHAVADCIYSAPPPFPLPSSSSSSTLQSSTLPCDDESGGTVRYGESIDAELCHSRQKHFAHYLSHSYRKDILDDIKRSAMPTQSSSSLAPSSSYSQTARARDYFTRKSYQRHIACVKNIRMINSKVSSPLIPTDLPELAQCIQGVQGIQGTQSSSSSSSSYRGGSDSNEDGSDDDDNSDEDDEEEEEEDDEDEEHLLMQECRRLEEESLQLTAPTLPMSNSSSEVVLAEQRKERKKESSWQALGKGLDSSYLRYQLRKKDLHAYVNDILCGEEGPFDNNCSTGLCPAMALDLLPMLGRMAQSESLKSAHHAEVNALMRASGEEIFDDTDRRKRGRTRRSALSSLARFEHLTCATQLSEPALEALLVYGFVAGRGEL